MLSGKRLVTLAGGEEKRSVTLGGDGAQASPGNGWPQPQHTVYPCRRARILRSESCNPGLGQSLHKATF